MAVADSDSHVEFLDAWDGEKEVNDFKTELARSREVNGEMKSWKMKFEA